MAHLASYGIFEESLKPYDVFRVLWCLLGSVLSHMEPLEEHMEPYGTLASYGILEESLKVL